MSVTPQSSQRPARPVAPLTGSERLRARASLAWRRMHRFARAWLMVLLPVTIAAALVPVASGDGGGSAQRDERERLAADTLRTAQRVRLAEREAVLAESLHTDAMIRPPARSASLAAPSTPARPAAASSDPVVTALGAAIQEARRLRTVAAWLAVAEQPPVSGGPRMRGLADSLRALASARDAIPPGPERDQRAAELTRLMSRVGYTILAIAEYRRSTLEQESGSPPREEPAPPAATTGDVVVQAPDTGRSSARLRAARDSLLAAQGAHARAIAVAQEADAGPVSERALSLASFTPALLLALVLLGGLAAKFAVALHHESHQPTIAHAMEAERTVGAHVLATVREAPLDGAVRFRPSGVDPFRMLYLGLTATGTRARTMIVTGGDAEIVAAIGARLAISAAADHRTTLVVDVDPVGIALSRTFRERAEPGLNDALAGAFKWREVARPVGSSDGLPITLLPAGTERDLPSGEELEARRAELTSFRSSFEFTIVVAPLRYLEFAVLLVETSPLVLCAQVGSTTLEAFEREGADVRAGGRRLHGLVLWDAPRPKLPTRAELAALLSTRKGRTPGGSFAAVQKHIEAAQKRQK